MLMADRPAVSAEVWIRADADTVWDLVTALERMGEWSPENEGGVWLEGGPTVGGRFEGLNSLRGRSWTTLATVTEADRPRRFGWVVNDVDDPAASWSFDLIEEDGGTRVVQRVRLGPGPSGVTAAIRRRPEAEAEIVLSRLQNLWESMHATLAAIKSEAEGART